MSDRRELKAGDMVKVTGGPFAGDVAPVQSIDQETGRVQIRVLIFGDSATVDMALTDVERFD